MVALSMGGKVLTWGTGSRAAGAHDMNVPTKIRHIYHGSVLQARTM